MTPPLSAPAYQESGDRKRRKFADSLEESLDSGAVHGTFDSPLRSSGSGAAPSPQGISAQKIVRELQLPRRYFERGLAMKLPGIEKRAAVEIKIDASESSLGHSQTLKIIGYDLAVQNACDIIQEIIKPCTQIYSESPGFDHDETLEIPSCKIGKVFGTKSKQIRKIREQSGAQIDVDNRSEPCKVRIRGDRCSVVAAKNMIFTLTLDAMDESSEYLFFPRSASGAILGKCGSRRLELQDKCGGLRIDVDKSDPEICKVRFAGGTAAQMERAKQLVMEAALVPPL